MLIRREPTRGPNHRGRRQTLVCRPARGCSLTAHRAAAAVAALLGALTLAACGSAVDSSTPTSTSASTSTPAQVATKARAAAAAASPGSPTPQANQSTGSSQLAAAPCASSQLALTYAGMQGATGHLEATFALHNVSGHSCTLHGYPRAELLNASGRALPTRIKQGKGFFPDTLLAPRQVVLKPGGGAQFGLGFADNNEYVRGRPCPSAAWLKTVPPNAAGALRIALTGGEHARFAPCGGQLVASPIYAG